MTEPNLPDQEAAADVVVAEAEADLEAERSTSGVQQVALLAVAFLFTLLAGIFATIAAGVTPADFSPRFTNSALVDANTPKGGYIAVRLDKDTDQPPGWWCFDNRALAEISDNAERLEPGELACLVPDVFTGTESWAEAEEAAAALSTGPGDDQAGEGASSDGDDSGTNWAAWVAGLCGLIAAATAALTQHEKFPWSAASKLARAKAKASLTRIENPADHVRVATSGAPPRSRSRG